MFVIMYFIGPGDDIWFEIHRFKIIQEIAFCLMSPNQNTWTNDEISSIRSPDIYNKASLQLKY